MIKLSSQELRQKWITYFEQHKHQFIVARSLIPDNDPSLLFVNSGVATLKPYFSGQLQPPATRLVNCQKAIRTNDIENVGKTSRHHTLFEMLGNFSIGDYFKEEAIQLAYDFLVYEIKIAPEKLYITVYEKDRLVADYWQKLGIAADHIFFFGREQNFWDIGFGPCGSCTEIFYDRGKAFDPQKLGIKMLAEDLENDRYIEIWNIVFSEFNNDGHKNYTPLHQKNIDTGAGLERLLAISQNVPTNFDTDLFQGIIQAVQVFGEHHYDVNNYFHLQLEQTKINEMYRIIADHLRAIVLVLADGIVFDNKGQGSIIRKLMRRIICLAKMLDLKKGYLQAGLDAVIESLGTYYTNIQTQRSKITFLMENEFHLFSKTLDKAWKILDQLIKQTQGPVLNAYEIFKLVESHGFLKEFLDEVLLQKNLTYDVQQFENYFTAHKIISKKNKDVKALAAQNEQLLQFHLPSTFDYHATQLNAQIIGLFDANWNPVTELNRQNGYVILDKTCLYALSGGQEADYGTIEHFLVSEVFKGPNNQHVHFVHDGTLKINQSVTVAHDITRRQQLSRQHSSEHLLHAALKHILSPNIKQEGAAKSFDKISLDFRYHLRPTEAQLVQFEDFVNQKIAENHSVTTELVDLTTAKQRGANAYFEDTYKKQSGLLRLLTISPQSLELCGGTHVQKTAEIEQFVLLGLESKGAGSWRIEAISGHQAIKELISQEQDKILNHFHELQSHLAELHLNAELDAWNNRFDFSTTWTSWKHNQKVIKEFEAFYAKKQAEILSSKKQAMLEQLRFQAFNQPVINNVVVCHLTDADPKMISAATNAFFNELNDRLLVIFNDKDKTQQYYLSASKQFWIQHKTTANSVVQAVSQVFHGRGGGRVEVSQGSFAKNYSSQEVIAFIKNQIH